ncbi:cupin-like domain-containing protein [Bradyrhizobium sp. Pha-3]|uniref:cupin-like domain-containing protein n=1 Tax=Bradyrhizobium sp. Pha-3 TaxID=208375 RepID=UPI0035D4DA8E
MNTPHLSDVNGADWFTKRGEIQLHVETPIDTLIDHGVPVVLRGGRHFNYLTKHQLNESLLRVSPDTLITVQHRYRWEHARAALTAASFLAELRDTEYYWRKIPLSYLTIDPERLYRPANARPGTAYFDLGWLGPRSTVQTFHQDNEGVGIVNHNLFMQICGHKYVAIAAPTETAVFESRPLAPGVTRHSSLDPRHPESQCVATLQHAILQPGDLLYIPPMWWHFLVSIDVSLSLSRWWFSNRIAQELYALTQPECYRPKSSESPLTERDYLFDIASLGGEKIFHGLIANLPISVQYRLGATLARIYSMGGS